jgi:hypothetical protein
VRLAVRLYLLAGLDPSPVVGLPERVVDSETDSPELAAVLGSPEARAWSPRTVSALRAIFTKSEDRVSERDIFAMGQLIEGQRRMIVRVVEDDPVERAKARKGARKR